MIGDLSALEDLKCFRFCLDSVIKRIEKGEHCQPDDISIRLLLRARECLASARTEEHCINESEQEAVSKLPPHEHW